MMSERQAKNVKALIDDNFRVLDKHQAFIKSCDMLNEMLICGFIESTESGDLMQYVSKKADYVSMLW